MHVSIVMAAFNAETYIGEAVESVLAQTHDDWELLIVDDGSTDGTAARVRGYDDDRIRMLAGPHVGLLAEVRNRGLDAARGEVVALLDSDDVWLPEKLARQLTVLRDRSEVGLVHTAAAALVDGVRGSASPPPPDSVIPSLLENNFVFSSSVLLRRSLLGEHGAFDPDPVFDGSPDYELWLRLAPRIEFAHLDDVLLLYRVHSGQMSERRRAMALGALAALERARARDPELVSRYGASFRLGTGRQRLFAGDRRAAIRDLCASLVRRPADLDAWRWLGRAVLR